MTTMTLATPAPDSSTNTPVGDTPRTNGLSEVKIHEMLAALGRRRNDPDYVERLYEGAMEARRQIDAEYNRYLDEVEREAK